MKFNEKKVTNQLIKLYFELELNFQLEFDKEMLSLNFFNFFT